MNKYFFLCLLLFLIKCSTQELRLIGITSKLEEIFFYGKDFTVSAWKVDSERLNRIRLEIKNSVAVQKLENSTAKWKEITELSTKDGIYILFQIFPESRVPVEFLNFQFALNGEKSIKFYSYYQESIETNTRNRNYYPGPFFVGGFYGDSGGFVYPLHSRLHDKEFSQKLIHSYNYLILFSKELGKEKNLFRVFTPEGNLIDFEFSIP